MRRFSSEGSLLDLDVLPWKTIPMRHSEHRKSLHCDAYTPHLESDELDGRLHGHIPVIQETKETFGENRKTVLSRENSSSVENLSEWGNLAKNHLEVCPINEGCRAYSDSQLAPNPGGTNGLEHNDRTPSPSASSNSLFHKSQDRHHHRAKLSAAKLHLKSLFGQVRSHLQWKLEEGSV